MINLEIDYRENKLIEQFENIKDKDSKKVIIVFI